MQCVHARDRRDTCKQHERYTQLSDELTRLLRRRRLDRRPVIELYRELHQIDGEHIQIDGTRRRRPTPIVAQEVLDRFLRRGRGVEFTAYLQREEDA